MGLFAARRPPRDARKFFLDHALHPCDFGFVQSLFNPHGSTGQALRTPTLRVVPGLTAVADGAASGLPRSRLATLSIRESGSLVRAGARVFGDSDPTGCRSLRSQRIRGERQVLGDAQTIEIGTLALDNDVGFAFAKSGQSRVLFRDWVVGSVLAKQIRNARSVKA